MRLVVRLDDVVRDSAPIGDLNVLRLRPLADPAGVRTLRPASSPDAGVACHRGGLGSLISTLWPTCLTDHRNQHGLFREVMRVPELSVVKLEVHVEDSKAGGAGWLMTEARTNKSLQYKHQ